jgi:hypothetical protein
LLLDDGTRICIVLAIAGNKKDLEEQRQVKLAKVGRALCVDLSLLQTHLCQRFRRKNTPKVWVLSSMKRLLKTMKVAGRVVCCARADSVMQALRNCLLMCLVVSSRRVKRRRARRQVNCAHCLCVCRYVSNDLSCVQQILTPLNDLAINRRPVEGARADDLVQ